MASSSRTIVIKASRETLGLVVAASAMTFALAYAVHSKQAPVAPEPAAAVEPQQQWTGHLADLTPAAPAPSEPLSSAALVVPKSQLALPTMPVRPLVKLRGCQDAPCPARTAPVPPARRQLAEASLMEKSERVEATKSGLLTKLNPLNHLPDMSLIGRPFALAGGAVSGWIKRF